jgi:glycosyltransferase involved in cell wall biosynthesis
LIDDKKVVLVMPAYNAELTLKKTYAEIPRQFVDDIILVDDHSTDRTFEVAKSLGLIAIRHDRNKGYGANQKTCYAKALEAGADVVVMLHPDYQYSPRLIPAMVMPIVSEVYDCMIGSRILQNGALRGGMPLYKYVSNRLLTLAQNLLLGSKFSEFHTGYRAYSREALEAIPFHENDDDFIFDNEILCQMVYAGFRIGEISCPTHYAKDSSSISFTRSCKYGLGVLRCSVEFLLHCRGLYDSPMLRALKKDAGSSGNEA